MNPARTRHCDRGGQPQTGHWRSTCRREGAAGRPGSQETSLRPQSRYALVERGGPLASQIPSHRRGRCDRGRTVVTRRRRWTRGGARRDRAPTAFVRVEGAGATLLSADARPHPDRNDRVKGQNCSATSAAGALDDATHGQLERAPTTRSSATTSSARSSARRRPATTSGRCSSTAEPRAPAPARPPLHPGDHVLWFDCHADANFNCTNNPLALTRARGRAARAAGHGARHPDRWRRAQHAGAGRRASAVGRHRAQRRGGPRRHAAQRRDDHAPGDEVRRDPVRPSVRLRVRARAARNAAARGQRPGGARQRGSASTQCSAAHTPRVS